MGQTLFFDHLHQIERGQAPDLRVFIFKRFSSVPAALEVPIKPSAWMASLLTSALDDYTL